MLLSSDNFKQIVRCTPLISIDLIVYSPAGKVLFGYRTNSPAKNTWFVPGGRIHKDESFADAFNRTTETELGFGIPYQNAKYKGLYEHIYPNDNYAGDPEFSTHYLVNAFEIFLEDELTRLPKDQHNDYCWLSKKEILEHPQVHQNSKNYFNGFAAFSD